MAVDLVPEPAVAELAERNAAFVREVLVPVEVAHDGVVLSEQVRAQLQQAASTPGCSARVAGVPRAQAEDARARHGVRGGRLLAPLALNIATPDEGYMHMLEAIASAGQKQR
jgi:acyl-CoA dehydrogenase